MDDDGEEMVQAIGVQNGCGRVGKTEIEGEGYAVEKLDMTL